MTKRPMQWSVRKLKDIIHRTNRCNFFCHTPNSSLPESDEFSFMVIRSNNGNGKKSKNPKNKIEHKEPDYSLNDVMLRGRVSAAALEKTLPSGDKVVEFRLVVSRLELSGVDTLDIGAWSAKARRSALSLKPDEWIEISGSIHRRFWKGPNGLASRWQVEAVEISRI